MRERRRDSYFDIFPPVSQKLVGPCDDSRIHGNRDVTFASSLTILALLRGKIRRYFYILFNSDLLWLIMFALYKGISEKAKEFFDFQIFHLRKINEFYSLCNVIVSRIKEYVIFNYFRISQELA